MNVNTSSSPSSAARSFPLAAPRSESSAPTERNWDDTLDVVLAGSVPIIGAGMNLGYGGMVALLSQKRSLGALALVGGAANLLSLPLLASGNYLAAIAAMGVSAATLDHIHRSF
jgi:hypothetical protein